MSPVARLHNALPSTAKHLLIAFSGGVDSTALLLLCSQLQQQCPDMNLRAIHIHHGLSANADYWAQHCENLCKQLKIPCIIEKVQLEQSQNIEAAARQARFQGIRQHWQSQELLLTAHHAQDQTETFLLALKRGSGLKGLSAIKAQGEMLGMPICRPLLEFTRAELTQIVQQAGFSWVEDESNQNNQYDRNFLRNEILPKLRTRFPHFDAATARAAKHCADAESLLHEFLSEDLKKHSVQPNQFKLGAFSQYSAARQQALLRLWFAENQLLMPSSQQLQQLIDEVIFAKVDANPQFKLQHKWLRRFQNCLYLTESFASLKTTKLPLTVGEPLLLPDNLGLLESQYTENGIRFSWQQQVMDLPATQAPISIQFAQPAKIRYSAKRPREQLSKLLQRANIPPWERERIPLIYYGEQLQAVWGIAQSIEI